ncbi:MAG: helicase SNF2 [Gammaproteobacteria bacterium]|nr:helicase SNF2 [Gammaproteobacteria bacterium]MBU1442120.1 helicase SNF2 [Gammaproteobacteria bacterium]
MKTSKIIAAAALSMLAAVGAQAESYEGVHQPVSAASRAEVNSQAVVAAHSANPYAEGYAQGVSTVDSNLARATVRDQAVVAARNDNPYAEAAMAGVTSVYGSTVDRAAVRAQARAAARGDQLAL